MTNQATAPTTGAIVSRFMAKLAARALARGEPLPELFADWAQIHALAKTCAAPAA